MNVIGSRPDGWWRDRSRAMTVLVERPPSPPIESSVITVTHAPEPAANSADDEIVRLVLADAHPERIRVATSDRALSERIRATGAATYPAEQLRNLIDPRP